MRAPSRLWTQEADRDLTSKPIACGEGSNRPYARRESGGRRSRQPGQIRKEAAVTSQLRVVPAPTAQREHELE